MTSQPTADAEPRLEAVEQRLSRLEALLAQPLGSSGSYQIAQAAAGITIIITGHSTIDRVFMDKLGELIQAEGRTPIETPVSPWNHLVHRRHPWRRQLSLKGRNLTVRQLIGSVTANKFSQEQAAANHGLPLAAIREAFAYAAANPEVLELDQAHERFLLVQEGKARAPRPVSG